MAHAEENITIDRPIQKVFDFVLDGKNNPRWRSSVLDIKLMPGKPLGLGAVFKQGLKGPGGRIDGDYELVEVKPNELIKFQVIAGPARPTGTFQFEANGKSTRVSFIMDFQPKGLAKLMDNMINKSMQDEVKMLSKLKTYLESSPI
jgi:uncharacterized membrane protein